MLKRKYSDISLFKQNCVLWWEAKINAYHRRQKNNKLIN